jgi:hypothetical protein
MIPGRRARACAVPVQLGAVALALAAATACSPAGERRPAVSPIAQPDRFAAMHPETIYNTAVRLVEQDRDEESLPWFRASLARVREDFWQLHFNYFAALRNTALEDTVRLGLRLPALRSSAERVALMREALRELDRAEALAPNPDVLAMVRVQRARAMRIWGMAWEAWLAFRLASEAVSNRPFEEFLADDFSDLMHHPTRPPKPHETAFDEP